jgi:hypothetical protein
MEPNKRNDPTDSLLEAVNQKTAALDKTLTAQGIAGNGSLHAKQGQPLTLEQNALVAERDWWEKAHKGFSEARTAMEQAEKYEHQRGAS